jgi:hypothetical protein
MTLKLPLKNLICLILSILAITWLPGNAQNSVAMPLSPASSVAKNLPISRTVVDSTGRKLEGTIIGKDADSIQFRRSSDGKEFDLPLAKLSAGDQKFVANLETQAATIHPPSRNKPLRLLYAVPHDAVLVGDFYTLQALEKLGYLVTLTSEKVPPNGWVVNAITGFIPDATPGQRPANRYTRTNKRLNPALVTIPMDAVKITDYDALFLCMEKKATQDNTMNRTLEKWSKEFISAKKPVVKRDQNHRQMHGRIGTYQYNFLAEENGVVLYNDQLELDEKPAPSKADDGSYDPGITRRMLNALQKALDSPSPLSP